MLTITPYSVNQHNINYRNTNPNFKAAPVQKLNKTSKTTAFGTMFAAISAFFVTKLEEYFNKTDVNGYTKIHDYCEKGKFAKAKFAFNHCPNIDINKRTKTGQSYIDCVLSNFPSIYPGADEMCEFISSKPGYDPNLPSNGNNTDAYNIIPKYPDIAWEIMERPDFDVNKKGMLGYIIWAAINAADHEDDEYIYTKPGDYLLSRRDVSLFYDLTINLIFDKRYNPNSTDSLGNTDIHMLSSFTKNANIDAKNLIKTILEIHPEFDVNLKNNNGKTCIDIAKEGGRNDIVELLNDFANKTGVFAPVNTKS